MMIPYYPNKVAGRQLILDFQTAKGKQRMLATLTPIYDEAKYVVTDRTQEPKKDGI